MDNNFGRTIKVKRPVTIKTVVTDMFKKQASDEINKEIHLIDTQIMQLEIQNKQIQDQAFNFSASYGEDATKQIQAAIEEISSRLEQMSALKQELVSQRENLNHMALNNVVVTGSLENYVELKVGENIYDRFRNAEILVKDGIIQEINV